MYNIKTNKFTLLEVLKKNREEHRKIFLEACEGYREQAVIELEHMLDEAKKGKKICRSVSLIEPMDQTKDYDRAIKMLEMEMRTEVELTEVEFAQYVMDDWRWKDQFTITNSVYQKSQR
jgi:hypothetical protein